jgi:hypothetical protein
VLGHAEAYFDVMGINWVSIVKEIDCQQHKIGKVIPDVIYVGVLWIQTQEVSPCWILTQELDLGIPRHNEFTYRVFNAWIRSELRRESIWVVGGCKVGEKY